MRVKYFSNVIISALYSWSVMCLILSLPMFSLGTMLLVPRGAEVWAKRKLNVCSEKVKLYAEMPPHPPSANTKVKLADEAVLNYFKGLELGC